MPQPRSRKDVESRESCGEAAVEEGLVREARWEMILDSAFESLNQTVPVSEGLAAWLSISVV